MRRKDLQTDETFAWSVAGSCDYAVLAMVLPNGDPYCVPISPVCVDGAVYFHSAAAGVKVDAMRESPSVCITCVGNTRAVASAYDMAYESAIVSGTAKVVSDEQEAIAAYRALCERYAGSNMESFDESVAKSMPRALLWKVTVSEITGKRKVYDADGNRVKQPR